MSFNLGLQGRQVLQVDARLLQLGLRLPNLPERVDDGGPDRNHVHALALGNSMRDLRTMVASVPVSCIE